MRKYYSMVMEGRTADIDIFGDITSWEWFESDVSSYTLSKELEGLDVDLINVHINSYGGETAEGLAIHNKLKQHPAKIVTYCDGFACSAASIVFMAGDERVMNPASLLMIHNAWTLASGNADDLKKAADDLEIISNTAANAYRGIVNISDEELDKMLDEETWIAPEDAVSKGFATTILKQESSSKPTQSVRAFLMQRLTQTIQQDIPSDPDQTSERLCRIERAIQNMQQKPIKPIKQKTFMNFRRDI